MTLSLLAVTVATLADILSTLWANRRGYPERNPLVRWAGRSWIWLRVATTATLVAATLGLPAYDGLERAGLYLVAALWTLVAALNLWSARRPRIPKG